MSRKAPCSLCGYVHATDDTRAIGRFSGSRLFVATHAVRLLLGDLGRSMRTPLTCYGGKQLLAQQIVRLIPTSIAEANRYVLHHRRHLRPARGALFALAPFIGYGAHVPDLNARVDAILAGFSEASE